MKKEETSIQEALIEEIKLLNRKLKKIKFPDTAAFVYNPLDYAITPMELYFRNYANTPKQTLFLGMNPGPFGMMQTGVPFGEVSIVKNWLKLEAPVKSPKHQHPKRPIQGFSCTKSEVSGKRLWGLFSEKYSNPKSFFKSHFVLNYCPLGFLEEGGKNLTPDKFPKSIQAEIFEPCDQYLKNTVHILEAKNLVGVGDFAFKRFKEVFKDEESKYHICKILHPSPASPLANKNWAGDVKQSLEELGIW
jgi:single-strand selective monofunctional uracil DNA glycosylase